MSIFGIEALNNPLALAARKANRCLMASSYDRRGGNHDWSNYVRAEGAAAVLMEAEGPGCITRIWTADPQHGTVRIFLDGSSEPVIEMPFRELFGLLPLSFGIGGEGKENYERSRSERLPMGHTSYCPIPFQHACKVTIDPEDDYLYYHINYDIYPPGTMVETFNRSMLDTADIRAAEAVQKEWDRGEPLQSWSEAETTVHTLDPDETVEILADDGAGIIRGLRIALPSAPDERSAAHIRDNVWLTAHFDDDEPRDPSVRAHYWEWDSGYSKQQSTRPQTLGYGLVDSPSGQAAWILEKFWAWTDCNGYPENALTRDELLDNIMFYWLPAAAASSARLYWESFGRMASPQAPIHLPVGVSIYPREIFRPSRRWAQARYTHLTHYNVLDKGGHFAAFEQPEIFVDEVRSAFRALR